MSARMSLLVTRPPAPLPATPSSPAPGLRRRCRTAGDWYALGMAPSLLESFRFRLRWNARAVKGMAPRIADGAGIDLHSGIDSGNDEGNALDA